MSFQLRLKEVKQSMKCITWLFRRNTCAESKLENLQIFLCMWKGGVTLVFNFCFCTFLCNL